MPILIEMPTPTLPVPEPMPIPESILIPEFYSGPTIRNLFQKTLELAGIDSDENFIFPIIALSRQ